MQVYEINPYVRFFLKRISGFLYPCPIYAHDFRLFCVIHGSITIEAENEVHILSRGGLAVLPPALGYRLIFNEDAVEYIVINFDFVSTSYGTPPKPPLPREQFLRREVYSFDCPAPFSKPFYSDNGARFHAIFDALDQLKKEKSPVWGIVSSGLMKAMLGALSEERTKSDPNTCADETVEKVYMYVRDNLSKKITNGNIAEAIGYHPNYLNTRFLSLTGYTVHDYVERQRITRAKELLSSTSLSVAEVAEQCGFPEPSYFVKFFVRHEGVTPKKYRKRVM